MMSRLANNPVTIPAGVEVDLAGRLVKIRGGKGSLQLQLHELVELQQEDSGLRVSSRNHGKVAKAMVGTTHALLKSMVKGVLDGFERRLKLQGVGFRARAQGEVLNLTLGFSHPVNYPIPVDVQILTPNQTEIVVSGPDRQRVGQVAAEIRSYYLPEPYKGKGIRYADEHVRRKASKKK